MSLVHIGDRLGDGRAVRNQYRIYLIFRDELLVEDGRSLPVRLVIIDHELNAASQHPTLLIGVLFAEEVTLSTIGALYGRFSGERHRRADPDRLLGLNGWCSRAVQRGGKPEQGKPPAVTRIHG